jgi:hypothetical protein
LSLRNSSRRRSDDGADQEAGHILGAPAGFAQVRADYRSRQAAEVAGGGWVGTVTFVLKDLSLVLRERNAHAKKTKAESEIDDP